MENMQKKRPSFYKDYIQLIFIYNYTYPIHIRLQII